MFALIKQGALKLAQASLKDFICPQCGVKFSPFEQRELSSFQDDIVCPSCGHAVPFKDGLRVRSEMQVNPPGPFARPDNTKIERKEVSATEVLFYIPGSGRWGGLLFFAIFWNAIAWTLFIALGVAQFRDTQTLLPLFFTALFPAIGVALAYFALRNRFAIHLLYLSPDRVRLQRELFGRRKNFDLHASQVEHVRKVEFYQQNYQPVYGIEIKASTGKVRFGSILTDDEKNWLCWEIREFLEPYAQGLR